MMPPDTTDPHDLSLPILYQDEHLVAVHKPSGLLVHRSPIDRQETRFALQTVRNQLGRHVYGVHRLDKGTSGILLFALSPEAGRTLSQAFEAQQVDKRYLAVVRGWPDAQGEIDYPLSRQPDEREPGPVTPAPPQSAHSSYQRLATVELPVAVERYPSSRYALLALTRTLAAATSCAATSSTSATRSSATPPTAAAGITACLPSALPSTACCWPPPGCVCRTRSAVKH